MDATQTFGAALREVARAREFARSFAWDVTAGGLVDDLTVLTSELVTTAVLYGLSPIKVHLAADDRRIHLDVTVNAAHAALHLPIAPSNAEIARVNRSVLEHLSSAWGAECEFDRTRLWAELPRA